MGSNEHAVTRHSDDCIGSWGGYVTFTGFVDGVILSKLKDEECGRKSMSCDWELEVVDEESQRHNRGLQIKRRAPSSTPRCCSPFTLQQVAPLRFLAYRDRSLPRENH